MQKIKILIAEDEASALEIYNDAISDFNDENIDINIVETICQTKEVALESIQNQYFDAAFIDLNLSATEDNGGIELIEAIKTYARYPIYIVSGQIQNIEHEFDNKFISKYDKDTVDTNKLLLEIKKIYEIGLTNVLGSKGIIEKYFNSIFWEHLSKSKSYWDNHALLNGKELENIISRYTLTHLLEYFKIEDSTGEEINSYDPSEMYINPNINKSLIPGSIVIYEGSKYLVLTPACTISQDNCDCLTLLKLNELFRIQEIVHLKDKLNKFKVTVNPLIESNRVIIEKLIEHGLNPSIYNDLKEKNNTKEIFDFSNSVKVELEQLPCKKQVSKLYENCKQIVAYNKNFTTKKKVITTLIKKYIKNNKSDRFYFLAEFLDFKSKVIDFQDIKTLDFSKIKDLEKIMDITTPFLKDIQEKFSSYYARQGAPDFNSELISEQYTDKLLEK